VWAPLLRVIAPEGSLLRTWQPPGQPSPRVTALEIALPGGGRLRAIARRHAGAAQELRLLTRLQDTGLPVPRPLGLVGDVAVTEWVEGEADLAPPAAPMAQVLTRIHRLGIELSGLPPAAGPAPINPPALLHGDLWPGNVLWRQGRLAAVIDWEDASAGDPLADLANSRLEMLWARGADAMRAFTSAYRSTMDLDYTALPRWDRHVAARRAARIGGWGLPRERLRRMRAQLGWFARQAEAAADRE
jgi:aminoglycoside phosphotransferase (APT) family kinase protein